MSGFGLAVGGDGMGTMQISQPCLNPLHWRQSTPIRPQAQLLRAQGSEVLLPQDENVVFGSEAEA